MTTKVQQSRGGRPRTGSVKWRRNPRTGAMQWMARITLDDGARPWVELDPTIAEDDEPAARACAALVTDQARTIGAVSAANRETVREWFKRLHDAKEAKGLATVKDIRSRFNCWVAPTIGGDRPIVSVARADIERVVARLDVAIAAFMKHGPGEGRLSPSTAANVWGDLQHAFDEAVRAKDPTLRVLTESPCASVRGPEAGAERSGQILYSDELLALLDGRAVGEAERDVPMNRRRTYAMAVYLKARSSELEALTAADVDLVHGTVTISKQVDRASKVRRESTKRTKTHRVRTVNIEPHVHPLLEHLVSRPEGKNGRLLHMPPFEHRAWILRADLLAVGVTRAALHIENDPAQRSLTFHDLRDTGLTHMAVRGDSPIEIQWAGGHTDFKTTQGYLDRGRVERQRIGEPLPPLPASLLSEPGVSSPVSSVDETPPRDHGKTRLARRVVRDSKAIEERRDTSSNAANRAESDDDDATPRDDSRRPKPERVDPAAAVRVAIKAALDAGDDALAARLFATLTAEERAPAPVLRLAAKTRERGA